MARQPAPIAPRMLTAEQAAAYLGYATTGLLANIPVKPVQMVDTGAGSQLKWDRAALDAWLDRLSGLSVAPGPQPAGGDAPDDADAAYELFKARKTAGGAR